MKPSIRLLTALGATTLVAAMAAAFALAGGNKSSGARLHIATSRLGRILVDRLDTGCTQDIQPTSRRRIRIERAGDDLCNSRSEYRVRARRCRSVTLARLHRHEERRSACALAGRLESDHLRMRLALTLVPAFADHLAVANDNGPHDRIRIGGAAAALRELQRAFEAHASSWRSRRYARGRSSRAKIDVPATNSVAPASRTALMLSGPIPPST